MELCLEVYPDYSKMFDNIFVRVKDLPVEDKLRDLRQVHLNSLIKIRGVVTKRTGVFPELKEEWYKCISCGHIKGPIMNSDQKTYMGKCYICHKESYFLEDEKCVYRNYQKWTI